MAWIIERKKEKPRCCGSTGSDIGGMNHLDFATDDVCYFLCTKFREVDSHDEVPEVLGSHWKFGGLWWLFVCSKRRYSLTTVFTDPEFLKMSRWKAWLQFLLGYV